MYRIHPLGSLVSAICHSLPIRNFLWSKQTKIPQGPVLQGVDCIEMANIPCFNWSNLSEFHAFVQADVLESSIPMIIIEAFWYFSIIVLLLTTTIFFFKHICITWDHFSMARSWFLFTHLHIIHNGQQALMGFWSPLKKFMFLISRSAVRPHQCGRWKRAILQLSLSPLTSLV